MDRRALLVSSLALAGAAGAAEAATSTRSATHTSSEGPGAGANAAALRRISAYAEQHRIDHKLPGLTLVCVDRDGFTGFVRTGYSQVESRRPVAADDIFQIGSISKSFVALMIHQLAAEGKLKLSDDIRLHLPGAPLPDKPAITLTHLLQHSSGLPDDAPLYPATPDGNLWTGFAPGSAWSYSNTGYLMLGHVVSRIDGRPLAVSLHERIFRKLGMDKTLGRIMASDRARYAAGYSPLDPEAKGPAAEQLASAPWINFINGAGCVAATSRDMAAWLRFLMSAGAGKGMGLLSDADARAFTAPGIDAPGWSAPGSSVGPAKYGSGLAFVTVEGRTLMHHTGGMLAFSSSMHVDPVAGVACFASTNMGGAGYRPRDLTAFACAVLRSVREPAAGLHPKPLPTKAPPAPPKPDAKPADGPVDPALAALAGRYETDDPWVGSLVITARPDGLYIDDEVRLERQADGYWVLKLPATAERLWFETLVDGRAQQVSLSGRMLERRDL